MIPRATTSPDADKCPAADDSKENREREQVEKRLVQSPSPSSGSVVLADDRRLEYQTTCEFLPVVQSGHGAERSDPQAAWLAAA